MKIVLAIAGLITAGPVVAEQQHPGGRAAPAKRAAPVAPLRPFEFKGFEAGRALPAEQLKECKEDEGTLFCMKYGDEVAGQKVGTFIRFYNDRLTSVLVVLVQGYGLPDVISAFQAKYGSPCESRTEKWQSQGGVTLDNPVTIWCFETGKLTVKQYGPSLTTPLIRYWDDFQMPAKAPKVDF